MNTVQRWGAAVGKAGGGRRRHSDPLLHTGTVGDWSAEWTVGRAEVVVL